MCKIIVSITFGAKKCFLLTWSYLNKSSLIRPSQSRCGNSVSCTNSIMHKKDSFLSYVWKMSSGKRSFCKKFHLPNVWRTNGSLCRSNLMYFCSSFSDSSQCSCLTYTSIPPTCLILPTPCTQKRSSFSFLFFSSSVMRSGSSTTPSPPS